MERVRRKKGAQSIGKSRGGWTCKIHLLAANERTTVKFHLSAGNRHDAPQGRKMVQSLDDDFCKGKSLLTDRAYEGDTNRNEAAAKGLNVVVPPKSKRKEP